MFVFNELIFNFWRWWYYDQLTNLLGREIDFLGRLARWSGLTTHLRFLLTPLYQQYSLAGRFISLLFRLFFLLFGTSLQLGALFGAACLTFVYLVLPTAPLIYLWLLILGR